MIRKSMVASFNRINYESLTLTFYLLINSPPNLSEWGGNPSKNEETWT